MARAHVEVLDDRRDVGDDVAVERAADQHAERAVHPLGVRLRRHVAVADLFESLYSCGPI